nr:helix-turn-helix domain-containing protein [Mycobacterium triplex]
MEPNWLNPREERAWRAFMHAHHRLDVHLNRGLQESGLSGSDYQVLAVLSEHDGDRMPARDLRNALGWEKSRVSHQVRRMQDDGLICREPNPDDARSTMVCLLPAAPPSRRRRQGTWRTSAVTSSTCSARLSSICSPLSTNESCAT